MINSLANKLKFIKLLEEIHKLKVDTLNNSRYETRVNNIDKRANYLYEMFLSGSLSDKEKVIVGVLKLEKKVKDREDKIKLKEWKMNKDRKKIGYLKYRAKIDIKVQKKLKEQFGGKIFSNIKKGTKDSMLANNKIILDELK
tara:strand:+ start:158 stop:583 length:426 start_codon:yes stop_codon:yes gene_type:complete